MIDTVVLRVHQISKYKSFASWLMRPNSGSTRYVKKQARELHVDFENEFYTEQIKFHDTGSVIPLVHSDTINSKSSHYELRFHFQHSRDFIEFNFSIPKYLYGSNVYQLIPHAPTKSHYNYLTADDRGKERIGFNYFVSFLKSFLDQYLRPHKVSVHDVEINRLDFCYNQIFKSVEDLEKYFKAQLGIRRKNAVNSNTDMHTYESSIFYKTDDHSFKIYQKGPEFRKNDLPKLRKANREKGFDYNIKAIHDLASRTLRYESTFRNRFLSKGYMKNIFRCEDYDWSLEILEYNAYLAEKKKYERRNLFYRHPKQKHFSKIDKMMRRVSTCYIRTRTHNSLANSLMCEPMYNYHPEFSFDFDIWNLCREKFLDDYWHFQVYNQEQTYHNYAKIKEIETSSGFRAMLSLMDAGLTIDQIQKLGIYSKTTFYRFKKQLLKDFPKNLYLKEDIIVNHDYNRYFDEININPLHIKRD